MIPVDDLYPEARRAVDLCKRWAASAAQESELLKVCQFYLFGSSIYQAGEQFNALSSDLDIICVLQDESAMRRADLVAELKIFKLRLELEMIPSFHRQTCSEPGVSIVAVTPFEIAANIHKSGARSFFDANIFMNLQTEEMRLALPHAGERDVRDAERQAIEFCQQTRNAYLGIAANNQGGLSAFSGLTPLPKALMRSAAQIAPMAKDGEWYDTRIGLEYLRAVLRGRSDEAPALSALDKKLSIRSGGNGIRESLSAFDQLLLAELLFDEACKKGSTQSVNWFVRSVGEEYSDQNATLLFELIRSIAPNIKLRGAESGSIVLKLVSPVSSYELIRKLQDLHVLGRLIGREVVDVALLSDGGGAAPQSLQPSRLERLLARLQEWSPQNKDSATGVEASIAAHLAVSVREDNVLAGAKIEFGSVLDVVDVPYTLDFLLKWPPGAEDISRIGIDVKVLTSKAAFFVKMAQVVQVGGPLILVVVGNPVTIDAIAEDISRLQIIKPNVHVVTRPSGTK